MLGIERTDQYLHLLQGKRVGLVVNQTSVDRGQHLVDKLLELDINITVLFAPEHGIRGNFGAGEHVDSGKDLTTGIPIQSIYGENKTPPSEVMRNLDVIVFDIQDVGLRFYTYISSMHYMMAAAAEYDVDFIVLDRPNPNGKYVDGPVLDMRFQSFVGMHPIPVLHGLTVGELAQMIVGEKWIDKAHSLALTVVAMQGYHKALAYPLPVPPSPNLPNEQAVKLYASLCLFEPTSVSIGRGTDYPFQIYGHAQVSFGDFEFTPVSMPDSAPSPKLEGLAVKGRDLRGAEIEGLDLSLLFDAYKQINEQGLEFFTSPSFFDKLAGTDTLRKAMLEGQSVEEVKLQWEDELNQYKNKRSLYLLYPQTEAEMKENSHL